MLERERERDAEADNVNWSAFWKTSLNLSAAALPQNARMSDVTLHNPLCQRLTIALLFDLKIIS